MSTNSESMEDFKKAILELDGVGGGSKKSQD
jgi:hypothetical protein